MTFFHRFVDAPLRLLCAAALVLAMTTANSADVPDELPELEQIRQIVEAETPPAGVVFVIYEYDEAALTWLMPRLLHYVTQLKKRFADLSISVVSHGDEILALTTENAAVYEEIHFDLETLVNEYDVMVHVCGAIARLNDLDQSDFPDTVDVVPFGPAQVNDYRSLDYVVIDLELL
jgi:intracellular sulfur oxidation DsrE/DsrF family protein